jgi:hypothetical protein
MRSWATNRPTIRQTRQPELPKPHRASTAYLHGSKRWMIRAELPNVVVLLSPFGIAGTRTGATWTQDLALRGAVAAGRLNWFISYLDAVVASAPRSND